MRLCHRLPAFAGHTLIPVYPDALRIRRNTFRISCQRSFGSLSDGFVKVR